MRTLRRDRPALPNRLSGTNRRLLSCALWLHCLISALSPMLQAQETATPPPSLPTTETATQPPATPSPAPAPATDDDEAMADPDPQAAMAKYATRATAAQTRLDALPTEIADEALRARVAEQWKNALSQWQIAGQTAEQLARRKQTMDGLAARLQAIQGEVEALRTKPAASAESDASHSLVDLETELRELDLNLPDWTKQLGQRAARIDSQAQRLSESRQAADEAQSRLAEKAAPLPDTLAPELKDAIREAQTARTRADHEIVANSEYFRNIQEPLAQLDAAERDLLSRRVEYGKTRREQLSARIAEKRQAEAETLRRESDSAAARSLDSLPPSFRQVAEENRELSTLLDHILEREKERTRFLQTTTEYANNLQSDYDHIRERLESGGGGRELGSYLWAKRRSLQREAYQASQNSETLAATAVPGLTLTSLDEMRRRIPRLEQELSALSDSPEIAALPAAARESLLGRARTLLDNHTKLIGGLSEASSRQTSARIDMETATRELRRVSERYSALVDRYVLHLPGSPPLWQIPLLDTLGRAANELAGLNLWRNIFAALFRGLLRSPWLLILLILAIAPTAVFRALAGRFKFLNVAARAPVAGTPRGLLWRAGAAFLRSYPAPLGLFIVGAAIWSAATPGGDAAAVGEALLAGVLPLLLVNLWRHFGDTDNLLETYVGMPQVIAARLRRRLSSVMYIGLPLWIVIWFVQNRTETATFQMLGGVVSLLLAALGVGFWWLRMRPAVFFRNADVGSSSLWQILHIVIMGIGVVWLGMSLLGYNYGALLVIGKAAASGLIVTLVMIAAMYWNLRLVRAREVNRARAILYYRFDSERRRARGEPLEEEGDIEDKAAAPATTVMPAVGAPAADGKEDDLRLAHHEEHDKLSAPAVTAAAVSIPPSVEKELEESLKSARRLVWWLSAAALAAILLFQWSDLFPVREWFGKFTLLARDNAQGGLTLLDVVAAVVGGGLCYAVARPLGSWINLTFFGWKPSERGTRIATLSLVRYLMLGIGAIWAAQELGVAWSDAQWLVAALGVGLGFGLQEIILNFVSGVILLFERPVRVGDMVSIGGADGTINRINIRTTTIIDADRRELIIPNKELVTGRVINWTLSDSITRMVIPVSVAYGTNLKLVQRLLLQAADSIETVLEDPAPSVYFQAMAESSLDFELRVYTARLEDRTPAQHQLRLAINRLFRRNSISIPFPQLDVHLYQEKE